ncbi:MAG: bifunctional (p)ppGpp synthetase/guanosine-3',5'-bis(diphosphate) 3'-pyrophosphohydrolase, partial [Gammaproteobacteria bacterium]
MKLKQKFSYLPDGTVDITTWIEKIQNTHHLNETALLAHTCTLTQQLTQGLTTFYGQPCLEQGLEVAEIILELKLDQETAAAGIISSATSLTPPMLEKIRKELGDNVAKLITGVQQMEMIQKWQQQQARDVTQIDKMRKMILAMATDIRVVIIKLAERLCLMRGIKAIPPDERKRFAQAILDIYAPLANRLGIGQLKWELEDLAFHYLDPTTYKIIAKFLAERRVDREANIHRLVANLKEKLQSTHIQAEVTGRAKHIYSIYLKANRKEVTYEDIYDQSAVRILVPDIKDCYEALSIVHSLWQPIEAEFDDYIANPKPNGYRSIHTAVIGENGKHFEIQIRTHTMHEEAER